jgi:hypothetical protein
MLGPAFVAADAFLAAVASVGTYYSFTAANLFAGDVMHTVLSSAGAGFTITALFAMFDIALRLANVDDTSIPFVRLGFAAGLTLFTLTLVYLVRWAKAGPSTSG